MGGNPAWKKAERRVARIFGTERNPLSGGNSGHTRSDSLHERVYIETKYRTRHAMFSLWRSEREKAKKEGKKITVLALREKGSPKTLFVVEEHELLDLLNELLETATEVPNDDDTGQQDAGTPGERDEQSVEIGWSNL